MDEMIKQMIDSIMRDAESGGLEKALDDRSKADPNLMSSFLEAHSTWKPWGAIWGDSKREETTEESEGNTTDKHSETEENEDEGTADQTEPHMLTSKGFLQHAGINRFSLCFNDGGQDGALKLDTPKLPNALLSVGQMHWGVDFQGVSVGKASAPVKFCSPESKKKGQDTACGAIPDSGTTLFMAPEEHIQMLFEEICDGWERCRTAASSGLHKV